jgi:RNA polymerase sigma-70 factor, ECF subfamily
VEDQEIIARILSGDIEQFKLLLDKYQNMVFSIASRRIPTQDVEEVAHECFIRVYRGLQSFRKESSFGTWLRRIALRCCCDYYRKKKLAYIAPALDSEEKDWLEAVSKPLANEAFERLTAKQDAIEIVRKALAGLSPEDRLLVEMVYFEGMSIKEAAAVLEKSVTATKVKTMRARKKMRKLIETII